jgi:hypothetical protein
MSPTLAASVRLGVRSPWLLPVIVLISLGALLVPVLVAEYPPLLDYPNHLSRLWLLSGGAKLPAVARMYAVSWDALTNLGIDLAAVGLSKVFSYIEVGRLLVAASVVLPPLGGVILWRVLHGQWHWWQIVFSMLAWSVSLATGFLNFQIGLGLALLAAVTDAALSRRGIVTTAAGRISFGCLILLVHFFAWIFYVVLLCAMAIGPDFSALRQRRQLVVIARSVLLICAAAMVPVILFQVFAPAQPGSQYGANFHSAVMDFELGFRHLVEVPRDKLRGLLFGIRVYAEWLTVMTLLTIVLPVLWLAALRRLSVHAGMLLAVAGVLVLYILCPRFLVGAAFIDMRFSTMAWLLAVLAVRPYARRTAAVWIAAFLLAVSLLRTTVVTAIWLAGQGDVAALARALAPVPPGAAIIPLIHQHVLGSSGPQGRPRSLGGDEFDNLVTLALPWRQAFVPNLFAIRGMHPVRVLPPWNEIAEVEGGSLASVNALVNPTAYAAAIDLACYLKFWHDRFDFALVVNADVADDYGPFVPPRGMTLVRDEGFAQLWRFDHAMLAVAPSPGPGCLLRPRMTEQALLRHMNAAGFL